MTVKHVNRLKQLMPPLEPPPDNQVDWEVAEDVFGRSFPIDFKEFVRAYGNVIWCDLFRAIYPGSETRDACQKSRDYVENLLAAMYGAKLWGSDGKEIHIPPYPASEGLLPCLIDTNSDIVCWYTVGHPDSWTTVLFQEGNLFFFPCDVTQLICDWIEQIPPAAEVWGTLNMRKFGIAR